MGHNEAMGYGAWMWALWRKRLDKRPSLLRLTIFIHSLGRACTSASWKWNQSRLAMDNQVTAAYVREGKGRDIILAKFLLQSTIYYVWRERNARRHHQTWTTTDQMRRLIDKAVRNRLVSLPYKPDHKYEGLLKRWFQVTI